MNKKGFTLIELLTVLVILAVLSLIAVPIVNSIIFDSKDKASEISVKTYAKAINSYILSNATEVNVSNGTYSVMQDGNLCLGTLISSTCSGNILEIKVDGIKPISGSVTVEDMKVYSLNIDYEEFSASMDNEGNVTFN